ncbi:hypothetical protein R1flu_016323 [Riccia fluitans]|uniref:Uncharacterized protein n=1 Tax=Riccia fluitans TaxID=41844 RepID=A0ABD1YLI5_9MARC
MQGLIWAYKEKLESINLNFLFWNWSKTLVELVEEWARGGDEDSIGLRGHDDIWAEAHWRTMLRFVILDIDASAREITRDLV